MSYGVYKLKNIGLPVITSVEKFADKLGLSYNFVSALYERSDSFYRVFHIPKRNSAELRTISHPSKELKAVQAWILRNILDFLYVSENSKGFEKQSSTLDNVLPHATSNYILSLDLENFFPSIKINKIIQIFLSIGYNKEVSFFLASICTFHKSLPQGAPTSPKLANLVCSRMDSRIQGYSSKKNIIFTRYADDITLSSLTIKKLTIAKKVVEGIIKNEGFTLNEKKTRFLGLRNRKKITGLIVSGNNEVRLGREKFKILRRTLYLFLKSEGQTSDINYINGTLSYIYGVDPKTYKMLFEYINKLCSKFGIVDPNIYGLKKISKQP
ncbi:retron St85 family RNA-directed DNA polymerase [Orbus wheelerorum]|uniref:retron St85 family RNA-directed DNA polymerase n=1 Tax=Orbus wheelerorum TaxID=3074111 RepID=UPI00370D4E60